MAFAYAPGSRPVEPYTIKHGLGSGGFGEVYYAVSDAGKEVALKLLCREPEIELRGIQACLNLNHPHLVTVYDLRQAGDGNWWLIMEYLAGPTWSAILQQHPQGLSPERVACWFQQLAKALDFLHQHAILHRDLKPSNIFLADWGREEWVKVGDYGLSKAIAGRMSEQHSAIGTAYYMAPEMAQGRYDHGVDVYAAGVLAFQLLTGQLPFTGQSVQEVLLRHLTDEPDWSRVPAAVVPVLRTALAKDPRARFTSVGELAQHLCDAISHIQASPARAEPTDRMQPAQKPISPDRPKAAPAAGRAPVKSSANARADATTSRGLALLNSLLASAVSAVILTVFMAVVGWNLRRDIPTDTFIWVGSFALLSAWPLLALQRLWWDRGLPEVWVRCLVRLVLGMVLGVAGAWLAGFAWLWEKPRLPTLELQEQAIAYSMARCGLRDAAFFGILFLLTPWENLMRRDRRVRFTWDPVILVAFLAGLLVWSWQYWERLSWEREWPKIAAVALTSVVLQLASPRQGVQR